MMQRNVLTELVVQWPEMLATLFAAGWTRWSHGLLQGVVWLLALVCWLLPCPAGFAEEMAPSTPAAPAPSLLRQSLDTDDISTEKINQFVQVYLQVLNLIEQRQPDLQAAELESEFQQIQREIEAEAVTLIQQSGLTLQEYLQLLSLTNLDPEFGERVAAQLQEATD